MTPFHSISCAVTSDIRYDQRMQRICTALVEAGYHVQIYSRTYEPNDFVFTTIPIICRFKKGILAYIEYNLKLLYHLSRDSSQIICAIDLDTIIPAYLISVLRNKTMVYDAHEYFVESPELDHRPIVKWVWRTIARGIIPRVRYKYTVNQILADELSRRYGGAWGVVRNVPVLKPNKKAKEKPSAQGQKVILYQGVLNVGRGLEQIIQAMPHIRWAQLWIAGDGDITAELHAEVERLRLASRVRFLGKLSPEELVRITEQAWLGVNLLNIQNLNYYYSSANKFFDYIQAGVPCLTMDTPVYRSYNDKYETAVLISDMDIRGICTVLQELYHDEDKYSLLVDNCKKAALIFHWDHEKKGLIEFYNKMR